MATLSDKIRVETDNLLRTLDELRKFSAKPEKNVAELAGMGAFIHNFYSGVEKILKQIFAEKNIEIPSSGFWHRELLEKASEKGMISEDTRADLGKF